MLPKSLEQPYADLRNDILGGAACVSLAFLFAPALLCSALLSHLNLLFTAAYIHFLGSD
jgi:hypothetical protein